MSSFWSGENIQAYHNDDKNNKQFKGNNDAGAIFGISRFKFNRNSYCPHVTFCKKLVYEIVTLRMKCLKLRQVQFVLYASVNTTKSARRSVYQRSKLWNYHTKTIYFVIIFTWNKCLSSRLIKCALFRLCCKTQTFVAKPFKTKESGTEKKQRELKF